ncbi:MAG TPA: FAD-dependent oxidoreductase [Streptosporangiaceae bacterium]|nr:FAD-dependent oxidoreductase [Streptosporangiaceae bacterium]
MPAEPTFVISGGGLAGAKAAEALREQGFAGRIVLIGEEDLPPYERPPLSKDYLQGKTGRDTIFVHPPGWYDAHAVELRAAGVDVTILETAELPLLQVLGPQAAPVFAGLHREHGVDLRLGVQVAEITGSGGRASGARLADGTRIGAGAVIVGVGAAPDTGLAEAAACPAPGPRMS